MARMCMCIWPIDIHVCRSEWSDDHRLVGTHTSIRTYIHTPMQARMHAYMHTSEWGDDHRLVGGAVRVGRIPAGGRK